MTLVPNHLLQLSGNNRFKTIIMKRITLLLVLFISFSISAQEDRREIIDGEEFIIHTTTDSSDMHSLCFDHYYEHLQHQLAQILKPQDTQLMMRYLDGFSYKEIGQQFAISESAAGVRIYRAKKQARRFFTQS